jgi:hypothetical protein
MLPRLVRISSGSACVGELALRRYAVITEWCDEMLRSPQAHESWLAAPFLHVISRHPSTYYVYDGVGEAAPLATAVASPSMMPLRHARDVVRSVWTDSSLAVEPTDIVLVGGIVDERQLEQPTDFYFGDLQERWAAMGIRSLLVLRNQTGKPTSTLVRRAARNGLAARIMLPASAGVQAEVRTFLRAREGARRMRRLPRAETPTEQRLRERAAENIASTSTTANLRLEAQIEAICRRATPRVVMTMYEGHAWERCAWRGARRASDSILCVGYQHTIIRESSHALRRLIGGGADPDMICCLGDVTRSELETDPRMRGVRFDVLGTHRRSAESALANGPRLDSACLVLPEGIGSEVRLMFAFALAAARMRPDIHFILRSHPIFPPEPVLAELTAGAPPPPNVELSTGRSLDEDVRRSGMLLYRGSSTVLYGILAGVKPFYLTESEDSGIDPLYSFPSWRGEVRSPAELFAEWDRNCAMPDGARFDEWREAAQLADRYTLPVDPSAVERLARLARKP